MSQSVAPMSDATAGATIKSAPPLMSTSVRSISPPRGRPGLAASELAPQPIGGDCLTRKRGNDFGIDGIGIEKNTATPVAHQLLCNPHIQLRIQGYLKQLT